MSYIDTVGIADFVTDCDRMVEAYGDRFKVSPWLRERAGNGQPFHG